MVSEPLGRCIGVDELPACEDYRTLELEGSSSSGRGELEADVIDMVSRGLEVHDEPHERVMDGVSWESQAYGEDPYSNMMGFYGTPHRSRSSRRQRHIHVLVIGAPRFHRGALDMLGRPCICPLCMRDREFRGRTLVALAGHSDVNSMD